jgi:uncharacterized protein YjaG (DUF416 family)
MDSITFSTQLASQIASLNKSQRLAFGLDLCNRLLPDYMAFFQEYNWGDPGVLSRSLEYVESSINTEIDEDKVNELMDELDLVIPDTEEFGDFSTSYAINASCAVWELLEYLLDDDQTHFMHMSTLATDTIDFKLQEIDDTLTAEELATHPMLVKEWQYQLAKSR